GLRRLLLAAAGPPGGRPGSAAPARSAPAAAARAPGAASACGGRGGAAEAPGALQAAQLPEPDGVAAVGEDAGLWSLAGDTGGPPDAVAGQRQTSPWASAGSGGCPLEPCPAPTEPATDGADLEPWVDDWGRAEACSPAQFGAALRSPGGSDDGIEKEPTLVEESTLALEAPAPAERADAAEQVLPQEKTWLQELGDEPLLQEERTMLQVVPDGEPGLPREGTMLLMAQDATAIALPGGAGGAHGPRPSRWASDGVPEVELQGGGALPGPRGLLCQLLPCRCECASDLFWPRPPEVQVLEGLAYEPPSARRAASGSLAG
ncbi:unnamed protein product, partial [Prorocentrum cordatum]